MLLCDTNCNVKNLGASLSTREQHVASVSNSHLQPEHLQIQQTLNGFRLISAPAIFRATATEQKTTSGAPEQRLRCVHASTYFSSAIYAPPLPVVNYGVQS